MATSREGMLTRPRANTSARFIRAATTIDLVCGPIPSPGRHGARDASRRATVNTSGIAQNVGAVSSGGGGGAVTAGATEDDFEAAPLAAFLAEVEAGLLEEAPFALRLAEVLAPAPAATRRQSVPSCVGGAARGGVMRCAMSVRGAVDGVCCGVCCGV